MRRTTMMSALMLILGTVILSSCDGGGGSTQPAAATIKLATSGTLETGVLIGAVDITVALPDGVTIKASPDSLNSAVFLADSDAVAASGAARTGNAALSAVYRASTTTSRASVRIVVVNVPGFGTGEFCTVTADLAAGAAITPSDVISIETFTVHDELGNVITGLTPTFSALLH